MTAVDLIDVARHVPIACLAWDPTDVQQAIDEIVEDAKARYGARFWPVHPQDGGAGDGNPSLYLGAAGVIWALDHLARTGATRHQCDFAGDLDRLVDAARKQRATLGDYGLHSSLHFGDMPALLVAMRIRPDVVTADTIYARANANNELPVRELMWGLSGSMLACIFMHSMTGEERWQTLFEAQAARLLGELHDSDLGPLWTQDLYGSRDRFLGPVHGFAGNMVPLLRGWAWLDEGQLARVADAVPRTLAANAIRSEFGAQWPAIAGSGDPPHLCQHCHGAPGMVTTFADAPFSTPELEELLIAGGELTWKAGPLAKGSNLCHGTGGNGYALLKLYRRTGAGPMAGACARFCDDGGGAMPASTRQVRTRSLLVVDRRCGVSRISAGLHLVRTEVPHRGYILTAAEEWLLEAPSLARWPQQARSWPLAL